VDSKDSEAQTPLHCATQASRHDAMKALLNLHASPNVQDLLRRTPLHVAAQKGEWGLMEILLQNGAHPGILNADGLDPLAVFAQVGGTITPEQLEMVQRLREKPLVAPSAVRGAAGAAGQSLKTLSEEEASGTPHRLLQSPALWITLIVLLLLVILHLHST